MSTETTDLKSDVTPKVFSFFAFFFFFAYVCSCIKRIERKIEFNEADVIHHMNIGHFLCVTSGRHAERYFCFLYSRTVVRNMVVFAAAKNMYSLEIC